MQLRRVFAVRAQLVNVQSNAEFASHQLNRDTWRDETLVSIVEGSFVFLQVCAVSSQERALLAHVRVHLVQWLELTSHACAIVCSTLHSAQALSTLEVISVTMGPHAHSSPWGCRCGR